MKESNNSGISTFLPLTVTATGIIVITISFYATWVTAPNIAFSLPAATYRSVTGHATIALSGLDVGIWRLLLPMEVIAGVASLVKGSEAMAANAAVLQLLAAVICLVTVIINFRLLPGPTMAIFGATLLCWAALSNFRPSTNSNSVVF